MGEAKSVEKFEGKVIAIIHRLNDNDDKLVVARAGESFSDKQIKELTNFQECYFKSEILRK